MIASPRRRMDLGTIQRIGGVLEICSNAPEGNGENDYYRVTLMKALVKAGADGTAKSASGATPVQVVSRRLAEADQPFYRACFQAKLDYLTTLSPHPATIADQPRWPWARSGTAFS